jgi:DNA-binding transcriptional ArsR family regulator
VLERRLRVTNPAALGRHFAYVRWDEARVRNPPRAPAANAQRLVSLLFNPTVDNHPAVPIFNPMVELAADRLDAVFHALADPTRRAMLRSLAQRERSVGELAEPFDMSLEGASKHIRVLERAGLVQRSVQGRTHVCRLDARPLRGGMEWIRHYERFWSRRLDVLDGLLQAEDRAGRKSRKPGRKR